MHHKSVLLVESNHHLRRVIAASLESNQWRVLTASNEDFAERLLSREAPDVLIVEFKPSSEEDGELIETFRDEGRAQANSPVLITAIDRPERRWLDEHQPDAIIYKPFDMRYLQRRMETIVQEKDVDGPQKED